LKRNLLISDLDAIDGHDGQMDDNDDDGGMDKQ